MELLHLFRQFECDRNVYVGESAPKRQEAKKTSEAVSEPSYEQMEKDAKRHIAVAEGILKDVEDFSGFKIDRKDPEKVYPELRKKPNLQLAISRIVQNIVDLQQAIRKRDVSLVKLGMSSNTLRTYGPEYYHPKYGVTSPGDPLFAVWAPTKESYSYAKKGKKKEKRESQELSPEVQIAILAERYHELNPKNRRYLTSKGVPENELKDNDTEGKKEIEIAKNKDRRERSAISRDILALVRRVKPIKAGDTEVYANVAIQRSENGENYMLVIRDPSLPNVWDVAYIGKADVRNAKREAGKKVAPDVAANYASYKLDETEVASKTA
ncbi:hypothetical protein JXD20_02000 [Candidatus Peregrinibacteria bacterium]|nr:hypothetical protein [Candidatus Peregrinibacteria bacterium]